MISKVSRPSTEPITRPFSPNNAAAIVLSVELVSATSPEAITAAFPTMVRRNVQAVVIALSPLFQQEVRQFVDLSAKHRLPAIAATVEFVEAGGLMSYGASLAENFRRAANYVDRIFKGAKPGDLPIEQPTIFDLAVNLKTARIIGITVSQTILVQATKVVQ